MPSTILWFRQDLRLRDQPALVAAIEQGTVIPVYILDDDTPDAWRMGGAQRWWLHHSLSALATALEKKGSRLILRRGPAAPVLKGLLEETGAEAIHAVRHYEPWWRKTEEALGEALCLHDGRHLAPVEDIRTGAGGLYRVYSSFWGALAQRMPPPEPIRRPADIPAPDRWPKGERLADWELLPTKPDWATGFDWTPGEKGARAALKKVAERVEEYDEARNLPSIEGTTRLSPHLHFGEVSPNAVWHAAADERRAETFLKELAWRDFAAGVILALPDYGKANGRERFEALEWRTGKAATADLRAWQRGRTGYPIVDAGMRQLWATGWMHNRVRMIAASFLVKHLLIDWRKGERWFWDTLVDADYGNNSVNWQWVAGSGVDANMFPRIMAPLSQSEKFDAGAYIRQWVPELAKLPDTVIHDPDEAGCRPSDYPEKLIGHREARERALAAWRESG
jgi:deoxyribodipyrimidine photo-lyase